MKKYILIILLFFSFIGNSQKNSASHNVNAVLWFQHSSEAEACYIQTFNYAKLRLRELAATGKTKMAIVSDLDETLIDNSMFYGKQVKENKSFTLETWQAWEKLSMAEATAGALDFLKTADSLGFTIFYLSNRYAVNIGYTLKNLTKLNFPQSDSTHILLYTTTTNKEPRRQSIINKGYTIEMLLGDNLNDFSSDFEKQMPSERHFQVLKMRNEYGKRYFVFPNPMYGAWMDALHGYQHHLSEEEKAVIREQTIIGH
ncbi:MAG: 5'-nucleotidase, lipoprotein e(P4) family [Bacteroidota bacterium]|nr:5'-nucleotidase, lipoprotein e(P4) family [Bacteroidota bacterium]